MHEKKCLDILRSELKQAQDHYGKLHRLAHSADVRDISEDVCGALPQAARKVAILTELWKKIESADDGEYSDEYKVMLVKDYEIEEFANKMAKHGWETVSVNDVATAFNQNDGHQEIVRLLFKRSKRIV